MRASCSKFLIVGLLLLVLPVNLAHAKPLVLPKSGETPDTDNQEEITEPSLEPKVSIAPIPLEPAEGTVPPEAPITITATPQVSVEDFGTLDQNNGGFAYTLWEGTSRSDIEPLFSLLPTGITSPALRDLTTRLMLTRAKAPEGGDSDSDFLIWRLRALFTLGQEDKALGMIKALPASFMTEKLASLASDILLVKGDLAPFCQDVRSKVERYDMLNWQKRLIFCQAIEKKTDEAQLSLDLLSEQHRDPEAFFTALIQNMLGSKKKPVELPEPKTFLDSAIQLIVTPDLPSGFAAKAPLALLRAAAAQKDLDSEVKAEVLERAVMYDMADTKTLVEAYEALAKTAKGKTVRPGVAGRADLYEALKAASGDKGFELLNQALPTYDQVGLNPLIFRLFFSNVESLAGSLRRSSENATGLDAFAILLGGGEDNLAERYLNLMPIKEYGFQKSIGRLMLAFYRYSPDDKIEIKPITLPADAPAADKKRLFRLYGLLEAFGISVPPEARAALLSGRLKYTVDLPSPALLDAFQQARTEKAKGKILLLSALLLGSGDLAHVSDMVLLQVIAAWRELGLEKEAKALALEAMLSSGR